MAAVAVIEAGLIDARLIDEATSAGGSVSVPSNSLESEHHQAAR
jgi:hypothetical protein